ncbi:hypothetical protein D8674_017855 [Pyrus ussuriensis x Pyrus communis]|uniref:SKP1 component POZ domain-containing protein n=1 Tax=Pyrus ussuriensis x Pyrus communis TaxID=2448454 RepID=A0A5N5HEA0_9ROSA|nr:hypothetical protein D8674_017855 [Pyrus ussuriensis x Pyrus communis]
MSLKKITIKSLDIKSFEFEEAMVLESHTIKHMIEDDCTDHQPGFGTSFWSSISKP